MARTPGAGEPDASPRLVAAGEAAILVVLGERIDPALNERVHALTAALETTPWVRELTPGYASLLVEYDPADVTYGDAEAVIRVALASAATAPARAGRLRRVPTVYGGDAGPDLSRVAAQVGRSEADVVRLHAGSTYRVYLVGFAPGHPYIGDLPPELVVPRLTTPRTAVPAGSVAIAVGQTVIYPSSTPGGWNLIGRTGLRLFDVDQDPPTYFSPGDQVQFVPTDRWEVEPADGDGAPAEPTSAVPSAGVEVISPGLLTLVQDLGRWGYARYGVPRSGAMDAFAARAGNLLVGNPPEAACLEITFAGPTLRFRCETTIAVTGADLRLEVDGREVPGWTAHVVPARGVLKFGRRRSGLRAYLAVAGGIDVPPVLGSRSTYLYGAFGGFDGRALRAGELLGMRPGAADARRLAGRCLPAERRLDYSPEPAVRVVLGPHHDRFPPEAVEQLSSGTYAVAPSSDRMGYRLSGPRLARNEPADLVSGGMLLGGLQVPGDGQPIVLMADHQTTGGYPLIATVIHADLPLIAQRAPGQAVRFRVVSLDEARAAYLQMLASLAGLEH